MNIKPWILVSLWGAFILGGWLTWHNKHVTTQSARDVNPAEASIQKTERSFFAAAEEERDKTDIVLEKWIHSWRETESIADESQRDQTKESLIEALARMNPHRAVQWARETWDETLRIRFLDAAMRGWGQTDPEAALDWVTAQPVADSGQAMASVFHGAASDPQHAIKLAHDLSQRDPRRTTDYGLYLLAALARADQFSTAAEFASTSTAGSRATWVSDAYSRWANASPKEALSHATQLGDPKTRKTATHAVLLRWAYNDAPAAAKHALSLPDAESRRFAFSKAIPIWVAAQPVEAAVWMSNLEPSVELDWVAASIATRPAASQNPHVSILWAENILEPKLRTQVIASVVHNWAETDADAARHYVEKSSSIRSEERADILAAFGPDFDPVSFSP